MTGSNYRILLSGQLDPVNKVLDLRPALDVERGLLR